MNVKIDWPKGSQNAITKSEIKKKYNLQDDEFYSILDEERGKRIILVDKTYGKYYIPNTYEEYQDFIDKNNNKIAQTQKMIDLAYYELGYRGANNELL